VGSAASITPDSRTIQPERRRCRSTWTASPVSDSSGSRSSVDTAFKTMRWGRRWTAPKSRDSALARG